jgi:hypothetical protein
MLYWGNQAAKSNIEAIEPPHRLITIEWHPCRPKDNQEAIYQVVGRDYGSPACEVIYP